MEHFGIKLQNKGKAFRLTREEFALISTKPSLPYFEVLQRNGAYIDNAGRVYAQTWCNHYRELCLKNYDLNMRYFSKLDTKDFENALEIFLLNHSQFEAVSNLCNYAGAEGYYIMVLDEYKQVYIGKSTNIKSRIMAHWTKTMPFDRVLFPMYEWEKSCFSINFFRALDTTRIFIWERKISNQIEAKLINNFPERFCINRIGGDITRATDAILTMKRRKFL